MLKLVESVTYSGQLLELKMGVQGQILHREPQILATLTSMKKGTEHIDIL